MTVQETVYHIGPEFRNVMPNIVDEYFEIYGPLVSKKQFGKLYELAMAYMICHKLKLAGYGESSEAGSNSKTAGMSIGGMFGISSISDGGTSISFNGNQGNLLTTNAEYALTLYGSQFLQLARMAIVPIRIVGGNYDA